MQPASTGRRTTIIIVLIVLAIVVALCCALAAILGGFFILRNRSAATIEQFEVMETDQFLPDEPAESIETAPPESSTDDETLPPANALWVDAASRLVAVTQGGVWLIDENSQESFHLSAAPLDAPNPIQQGLSPDKTNFAYFSGFGGASAAPFLLVIDLDTQETILQAQLSGPNSQMGPDDSIGAPAFEAMQSLSFPDSLAWSPDGSTLAFVSASEGDSSDVYLFDPLAQSVTRLTDEPSNAAALHWSPDGRYLQYLTVDSFGTGAGFAMDRIWSYDLSSGQARSLVVDSSGESFVGWADEDTFFIHSWSAACAAYNLRAVDAETLNETALVNSCFSGVAYSPDLQIGIFSVTDFNAESCLCGQADAYGTRLFGKGLPAMDPDDEAYPVKKLEQENVYTLEYLPAGQLFAVYGDDGLQKIYQDGWYEVAIPAEVSELKPYPSPDGDTWAWASYYSGKIGLWVTGMNAPQQLSDQFTGAPVWSDDSQRLYFFEGSRILAANAGSFSPYLLIDLDSGEIAGLVK